MKTQKSLLFLISIFLLISVLNNLSASECFTIDRSRPEWIESSGTSAVAEDQIENALLPDEFSLEQNYPNPFNPTTTIRVAVKEKSHVLLKVYDILGRELMTLLDGQFEAGYYNTSFDARGLPTGVYIYRVQMDGFTDVKKMVLVE